MCTTKQLLTKLSGQMRHAISSCNCALGSSQEPILQQHHSKHGLQVWLNHSPALCIAEQQLAHLKFNHAIMQIAPSTRPPHWPQETTPYWKYAAAAPTWLWRTAGSSADQSEWDDRPWELTEFGPSVMCTADCVGYQGPAVVVMTDCCLRTKERNERLQRDVPCEWQERQLLLLTRTGTIPTEYIGGLMAANHSCFRL